jgi:hypothetical protein
MWSMAVDLASGRKIQPLLGVRGARPSWTASLWGREGVTFAISIPAQKTRGDFSIPFFPQTMEIAAGYHSTLVIFSMFPAPPALWSSRAWIKIQIRLWINPEISMPESDLQKGPIC